jgi:hypothetical protein
MGTRETALGSMPIDEMVALLARGGGGELGRLREHYPEYAPLLEDDGILLGESQSPAFDRESRRVQMLLELAIASTATAGRLCRGAVPHLRKRLQGANRLRLLGEGVTLLSSAAIMAEIGRVVSWVSTFGLATLALLGSVMALMVQHRVAGLRPGGDNVFAVHGTLVKCQFQADRLGEELAVLHAAVVPDDLTQVKELLGQANALAEEVHLAVHAY